MYSTFPKDEKDVLQKLSTTDYKGVNSLINLPTKYDKVIQIHNETNTLII